MTKKQALKNWNDATEELTKIFSKKYFGDSYDYDRNDWVSCEIGGVICINDYWFNFDLIKEALEIGATKKELFEFYDYELEKYTRGEKLDVNFSNYIKYFRGFRG